MTDVFFSLLNIQKEYLKIRHHFSSYHIRSKLSHLIKATFENCNTCSSRLVVGWRTGIHAWRATSSEVVHRVVWQNMQFSCMWRVVWHDVFLKSTIFWDWKTSTLVLAINNIFSDESTHILVESTFNLFLDVILFVMLCWPASRYNSCKWPTWSTFLFLYVYVNCLHDSSKFVLIIRRINCINTTSGTCHSV
jgi:hypothetical protein